MEKEKKIVLLFVLVFLTLSSFVLADEWDSLLDETNKDSEDSLKQPQEFSQQPLENKAPSNGETKFTSDFYIALILLVVASLIIVYFAYSFFKKPKNKWEKQ